MKIEQIQWEEINNEIKEANCHLRIDRSYTKYTLRPLNQIDASENVLLKRRQEKKLLMRQNSKTNSNKLEILVE
jgi:hypothetical protein